MSLRIQVWKNLRRIQKTLNLTDPEIAEMMQLTSRQYKKNKLLLKSPPLSSAMTFVDQLNIGFDSLFTGSIDYRALSQQFFGNKMFMPEKYVENAFSKKRVTIHFFNFIEKNYGWEFLNQTLRNHQLHEGMFFSPDENVSLRLSVDLSNWLQRHGGDQSVLYKLGQYTFHASVNPQLTSELSKSKNLHDLYERIFGESIGKYFEKNYKWWIHMMNQEEIKVRGCPTEQLSEEVEPEYAKNKNGCQVRMGIFSSMSTLLDYPKASVEKTHCTAIGDPYCEFKIQFDSMLRQRPGSRLQVVNH